MLWTAALLGALPLGAIAQSPATNNVRTVSLQECIEMTLRDNLDLQIARYNPQISEFNLRQAYGVYDPTLALSGQRSHSEAGPTLIGTNLFSGSVSDSRSFNGGLNGYLPWGMTYNLTGDATDTDRETASGSIISNSGGSAEAGVRQPLLRNFWADSSRLAIKVGKLDVLRSEQTLKLETMTLVTQLEQAYYDLIFRRESVVVRQKAVDLAEQLVAENRKRVEVGAMAPLEAKQAESQAAAARADLIQAFSDLAVQENEVKGRMSARYIEWAGLQLVPASSLTAAPRSFDLQSSWRKGLTTRPEMIQTKLDLEQAGIQLKYDRNQLFPQLDVFATYGYNGSGNEFSGTLYDIRQRNRPYYTYGGEISIPLANQSARNVYKASKLSHQQAVLSVKALEASIMQEIDNAIKVAQANYERISATRAAREYAEAALEAEQKKLEQGKSTTYTVLQTQRDLTDARGNEIQALNNYNKSLADLSLAEGTTLERLGIDFKVE